MDSTSAADFGFGFECVLGIDTSQKQLDQAMIHSKAPNIEYQCQDIADRISVADDSVDLVTIAQGLHWSVNAL